MLMRQEDMEGHEIATRRSGHWEREGRTGLAGRTVGEVTSFSLVSCLLLVSSQGLGDLDVCNGIEGPTPEYPDGIYHYVTTVEAAKLKEGVVEGAYPYILGRYRYDASLS